MQHRRSVKHKQVSEINVVPYIDVMLVLLIIFMVTAPLLSQGVSVDLPETTAHSIKTDQEPIIVSVNAQGDFYLNIAASPDKQISQKALFDLVTTELKNSQQREVLVNGDKNVDYGKVVRVMALLQQAGAQKIGLLTQEPIQRNK